MITPYQLTNARLPAGCYPVSRITDTLEGTVHVDASPVGTHARFRALVQVYAKRSVWRGGESRLAGTPVGTWRVIASAVQADPRILIAFVNVCRADTSSGYRAMVTLFKDTSDPHCSKRFDICIYMLHVYEWDYKIQNRS